MARRAFRAVLIAALLALAVPAGAAGPVAQAAQATAAEAAPFLGEWTLNMQGQNGPATFELTIKVDDGKVVGAITGTGSGTSSITDITKAENSLVLRYVFDYQGNPVSTVVSLTPAAEGKMDAQIDFADGAYVMSGTAVKQDKPK